MSTWQALGSIEPDSIRKWTSSAPADGTIHQEGYTGVFFCRIRFVAPVGIRPGTRYCLLRRRWEEDGVEMTDVPIVIYPSETFQLFAFKFAVAGYFHIELMKPRWDYIWTAIVEVK